MLAKFCTILSSYRERKIQSFRWDTRFFCKAGDFSCIGQIVPIKHAGSSINILCLEWPECFSFCGACSASKLASVLSPTCSMLLLQSSSWSFGNSRDSWTGRYLSLKSRPEMVTVHFFEWISICVLNLGLKSGFEEMVHTHSSGKLLPWPLQDLTLGHLIITLFSDG